jgi:hypothetical protein
MEVENSENSSELGAKMRLALPIENIESDNGNMLGALKNPEAMITDETNLAMANFENDMVMDRTKHSKKDGAESPSLGSAGSREEPVREQ